jgi:hypothetical protein
MTLRSDRARTTARRAAAPPTLTLTAALTLQGWGARSVAGHPCHVAKNGVTGALFRYPVAQENDAERAAWIV